MCLSMRHMASICRKKWAYAKEEFTRDRLCQMARLDSLGEALRLGLSFGHPLSYHFRTPGTSGMVCERVIGSGVVPKSWGKEEGSWGGGLSGEFGYVIRGEGCVERTATYRCGPIGMARFTQPRLWGQRRQDGPSRGLRRLSNRLRLRERERLVLTPALRAVPTAAARVRRWEIGEGDRGAAWA
jgi:hypothetical protein